MGPITDLDVLLSQLQPERHEGAYVFVTVREPPGDALRPIMTFAEDEGLTLILDQAAADAAGLEHSTPMAWITLTVHSSLEAVGLTAAVSTALASAQISCNVVAAAHHDHLFVPEPDADRVLAVLATLSSARRGSVREL